MLDAIWWTIQIALKILGIIGAIIIVKFIVMHGADSLKELLETISLAIMTGCIKAKKKLLLILKKEKEERTEEIEEGEVW